MKMRELQEENKIKREEKKEKLKKIRKEAEVQEYINKKGGERQR